ncbi:unnamed protein product [Amoebophrya sp. A120]|nr:unnamed protein product [Amoebophrya sp. A120]|eukprot:GSA120T00000854001.1
MNQEVNNTTQQNNGAEAKHYRSLLHDAVQHFRVLVRALVEQVGTTTRNHLPDEANPNPIVAQTALRCLTKVFLHYKSEDSSRATIHNAALFAECVCDDLASRVLEIMTKTTNLACSSASRDEQEAMAKKQGRREDHDTAGNLPEEINVKAERDERTTGMQYSTLPQLPSELALTALASENSSFLLAEAARAVALFSRASPRFREKVLELGGLSLVVELLLLVTEEEGTNSLDDMLQTITTSDPSATASSPSENNSKDERNQDPTTTGATNKTTKKTVTSSLCFALGSLLPTDLLALSQQMNNTHRSACPNKTGGQLVSPVWAKHFLQPMKLRSTGTTAATTPSTTRAMSSSSTKNNTTLPDEGALVVEKKLVKTLVVLLSSLPTGASYALAGLLCCGGKLSDFCLAEGIVAQFVRFGSSLKFGDHVLNLKPDEGDFDFATMKSPAPRFSGKNCASSSSPRTSSKKQHVLGHSTNYVTGMKTKNPESQEGDATSGGIFLAQETQDETTEPGGRAVSRTRIMSRNDCNDEGQYNVDHHDPDLPPLEFSLTKILQSLGFNSDARRALCAKSLPLAKQFYYLAWDTHGYEFLLEVLFMIGILSGNDKEGEAVLLQQGLVREIVQVAHSREVRMDVVKRAEWVCSGLSEATVLYFAPVPEEENLLRLDREKVIEGPARGNNKRATTTSTTTGGLGGTTSCSAKGSKTKATDGFDAGQAHGSSRSAGVNSSSKTINRETTTTTTAGREQDLLPRSTSDENKEKVVYKPKKTLRFGNLANIDVDHDDDSDAGGDKHEAGLATVNADGHDPSNTKPSPWKSKIQKAVRRVTEAVSSSSSTRSRVTQMMVGGGTEDHSPGEQGQQASQKLSAIRKAKSDGAAAASRTNYGSNKNKTSYSRSNKKSHLAKANQHKGGGGPGTLDLDTFPPPTSPNNSGTSYANRKTVTELKNFSLWKAKEGLAKRKSEYRGRATVLVGGQNNQGLLSSPGGGAHNYRGVGTNKDISSNLASPNAGAGGAAATSSAHNKRGQAAWKNLVNDVRDMFALLSDSLEKTNIAVVNNNSSGNTGQTTSPTGAGAGAGAAGASGMNNTTAALACGMMPDASATAGGQHPGAMLSELHHQEPGFLGRRGLDSE